MQKKLTADLANSVEILSISNNLDLDSLNNGNASYDDLVDAFARELTADEVTLVSGAVKMGGLYCGGTLYNC